MSQINDYIASSNNSINDNKYNAKKARSKIHKLKQLLLAFVKRNSRKNTYKQAPQPSFYMEENCEIDQNSANELLEQRIFEEIDSCGDFDAVPVYNSNGSMDIVPVVRGEHYIPVHFARTEAGTFFWTSVTAAHYASDKSANHIADCQVPCDRWAQA